MSPPLPTATAMEIARYVLPDADDATVSAAASTIGLFAANCVWQAMMQIAEEQAQKVATERARIVALAREMADDSDRRESGGCFWCGQNGDPKHDPKRCGVRPTGPTALADALMIGLRRGARDALLELAGKVEGET